MFVRQIFSWRFNFDANFQRNPAISLEQKEDVELPGVETEAGLGLGASGGIREVFLRLGSLLHFGNDLVGIGIPVGLKGKTCPIPVSTEHGSGTDNDNA